MKPSLTYLAQPLSERERQYSRLNDGACDAKGRFLAATLQSTHQGNEFGGTLYQYDPKDRSCKILDDKDITDGNGLGWSEDNKTLYVHEHLVRKSNVIFQVLYELQCKQDTRI